MNRAFSKLGVMLVAVVLLTFAAGIKKANACHFAAADIFVTYSGPGADGCGSPTVYQYDVELIVYHACQTCYLDAGVNQTVRWESQTAIDDALPTPNGQITVTSITPQPDTVHSLCAAFADSNSCRQLSTANRYPAFRKRTYRGTVTLPYAREDWRFYWSNGGRNASNLTGCGSLYIEAGLNNVTKYNNSTPRFLSNPLPYICVNQPTTYLNGPWDPNGDSLWVVAQTPFTPAGNIGNPCGYQAGYSVADPIGSTGDYKLNNLTGTATFTPASTGFKVLAFKLTDYERGTGKALSYVYRDVQVTVLPCTSPPPNIDSIGQVEITISEATIVNTKSQGEAIFVCPGSNMEFSINSKTPLSSHNVYLYANTDLFTGSAFNVTGQGSDNVTGVFTWTPTIGDIGEHTLVIISKDSTCNANQPIVLTNYRSILIKVTEGINAGKDQPICELNPDSVQLFVYGTEDLRLEWSTSNGGPLYLSDETIHNPKALPPRTTEYIIKTPDLAGNCKNQDNVFVYHDTSNKVEITPKNPTQPENAMVMCRPGYLQLEALISGRPPKNNVTCGTGNPTLCSSPDTGKVYGSAVFGDVALETPSNEAPVMYNTLRTTKMQFLIRKEEMSDAKIYASTLRSLMFDTKGTSNPAYEYRNFKIFIKCTTQDELDAADGFENFGMTQIYSAPTITFEDGTHVFPLTTPYNWDTTKHLIIQMCYSDNPTVEVGCGVTSSPPIVSYSRTAYVSGLILRGADANEISVCGVDKSANINEVFSRPSFSFTYCEADPLPFVITWNQGEYLSDTTVAQPLAYVPKSTRYVVETIGRSGCLMRDTLDIYVPKHDFKVTPTDTAICYGVGTPVSAYGGWYYKWYEYDGTDIYKDATGSLNCPTCPEPFVRPAKTTDYRIVISDSVWCYDTLKARVEVLPLPDVHILNQDTTVKYGKSFQLLASGARLYNWSPVSSLSNPNISYPMASPKEDTRYVVGGIGANGCRAFDTLYVTIDNRDHLMVPGAFSPNGDGKNDVFKITNLTFQRIMEFRIFNRWGQEIFNTTDNSRGWDGTWKGEPQGIGTYSYLIRVGFPDGQVETYRGEVTLIR
ncbi:MAG: gliding motility-associated C-terminal domain-containing protein [Chitinophagales bacterium]|nr:gliding motility-associated C-terminal domain-containing protein [Chitinophagales bacterium]